MKRYEDMLMEILFFPAEDIVCASSDFEPSPDLDNAGDMPDLPFLPGM
jgi:hypothetical protein